MKKTLTWILSILLAAVMLLGCIPAMAEENPEWEINQYTQLVSRESTAEKLESIVVPAEVDGLPVLGVEYMAFNMHKNFKQLTIEDSAVMLDRRVLRDLLKLETVDLPENLLIIREGNFTNLPKLTNVVVPASVSLVHSSFNKCESLKSITFEGMCPVFVTVGSFGMFTDLPADCAIYVPDNQVSAYKAAFADREDVLARIQPSGVNAEPIDRTAPESDFVFDASTGTITGYTGTASYLEIPATIGGVQVKHIADSALLQIHGLCCIIVPEGVETLGYASLAGAENLSYVSLPSTLASMGASIFSATRVSAISYNAAAMPAYEATAFDYIKSDAWQLIMPYGTSQEIVDSFTAYLAANAPKAVVKASIIEPYSFLALDAEAAAAFMGDWYGVAGKDVMGEFTDYYPQATVTLNSDGTGVAVVEGDEIAFGWYVDSGYACMAAVADGVLHEDNTFCYAAIDENGRLVVDFGYASTICEQEGVTYAAPAVPEKPWPEFNADDARYYIGIWQTADGAMTLTLNDDGTATSAEMGEEAYALQWYADYPSAFVGPAMSELAEINFDGNGNIIMSMGGEELILAPYVEPKVIEGADELLGDWYDDIGNKLTLVNDGTMTYTYASDGWVDEYKWDVIDGAAVVTEGLWEGAAIYIEDGIVFIDNSEGIFQLFSVDGDLSAYYGEEEEYELPEAQPIGAEGEMYFGTWTMDMGGMAMNLILNQDGSCAMEMFGEVEPGVWTVIDGKANVMGDELYIDEQGQLVMESQGMVFVRSEGDAASEEMSEEEQLLALLAALAAMEGGEGASELPENLQPYVGTWHMVYIATGGLEGDLRTMGVSAKLELNADGTGRLSGAADDSGKWYDDEGQVRFGKAESPLTLLDGGFLRYGSQLAGYMVFSQDENAVWSPAPAVATLPQIAAAPAAPQAPASAGFASLEDRLNKKFVAKTYTSFGQTMDASMLGAEYAVLFRENGTCDFTLAGMPMPNLPWGLNEVSIGLNKQEAFVINYYGTMFNAVPTDYGFDMDYYGTMTLHFELAE